MIYIIFLTQSNGFKKQSFHVRFEISISVITNNTTKLDATKSNTGLELFKQITLEKYVANKSFNMM